MSITAVVTGGASGIGLATATKLRDEGYEVVIADLDPAAPKAARQVGVTALPLDVTSVESWGQLGAALDAQGRTLGALVLNAGVAGGGADLATLDLNRYHRLMAVNVDGVIHGLREMLPRLTRPGAITVTASLAGLTGLAADPVYAMTKHALVGLVRSIADGLARQGVRIHAVCPGMVDTPLLGAAAGQLEAAGFPLLTAEEIAGAISDLVTGRTAALVTVLQPGRAAVDYLFAGIPGPRMIDGSRTPDFPTGLDLGAD